MSLASEVNAVRSSGTLHDAVDGRAISVAGPGARAALERICPRPLALYEGQALHTLFLDERARPVADVYVCAREEGFLILADERPGHDLLEYLSAHDVAGPTVELQDLREQYGLLSLNGPYVWELLAELLTPEIIGLSYLGHYDAHGIVCLRAGKTGEYGYELLVPRSQLAGIRAQLLELGAAIDLHVVSRAALERCALENWFFDIRQEGLADLTPLELQLQWRVSYGKAFPGSAHLAELRARRPAQRVAMVASAAEPMVGAHLEHQGTSVGRLIAVGHSPSRSDWLGLALLDLPVSHPGLVFSSTAGGAEQRLRSISPPALNNRSLYVDPQRHAFATRARDAFPPLVSTT